MTVENFAEIVWTVFEKFEIFIERSGENVTIALVVKKFSTPKNCFKSFEKFYYT